MPNPYFYPSMSSNEIYYNQNVDVCLTDVVDGKAEAIHTHTHTDYAAASHTHSEYATANDLATLETEVDGKADSTHSHSYNDLTNKPTIPEEYTHPTTHPASMITGLSTVATSGSYVW